MSTRLWLSSITRILVAWVASVIALPKISLGTSSAPCGCAKRASRRAPRPRQDFRYLRGGSLRDRVLCPNGAPLRPGATARGPPAPGGSTIRADRRKQERVEDGV